MEGRTKLTVVQPSPIPVDAVDSFWGILGSIGDFVGGVGAAFALVVAALAYRRQVNDSLRRQASEVTVKITEVPSKYGGAPPYKYAIRLDNKSDQSVELTHYDLNGYPPPGPEYPIQTVSVAPFTIPGQSKAYIGAAVDEHHLTLSAALFKDAGGRVWYRSVSGSLVPLSRLEYRRAQQHIRDTGRLPRL